MGQWGSCRRGSQRSEGREGCMTVCRLIAARAKEFRMADWQRDAAAHGSAGEDEHGLLLRASDDSGVVRTPGKWSEPPRRGVVGFLC